MVSFNHSKTVNLLYIMHKTFLIGFILLFQTIIIEAQTYKNLVFEGAGMKGLAYIGVLEELEKENVLQHIEKVGGTSSGGITAMCIALGYTPKEMKDIIYHTPFKQFNEGKGFFIGGLIRFKKNFGWYKGNKFGEWVEQIIVGKTGDSNITFEEWIAKGFKPLYVTAASLTKQESVLFSAETYPKMKVKDAIRVTMSIPFYFEPVYIDKLGQIVTEPENPNDYNLVVDGGVVENYPIYMFDGVDLNGNKTVNPETLGVRIDRTAQVKNDKQRKGLAGMPIKNYKDYVTAMYRLMLENLNRQNLSEGHWQNTISIDDGSVGSRVRAVSVEEKEVLLHNGRKAVKDFFRLQQQTESLEAQQEEE